MFANSRGDLSDGRLGPNTIPKPYAPPETPHETINTTDLSKQRQHLIETLFGSIRHSSVIVEGDDGRLSRGHRDR
jgi:hypothetical protein